MTGQSQLIWGVFVGAIALAVIELAVEDWRNEAAAYEENRCKDKSPEFKAMMVRLPGEGHNVEWCAQFLKFTKVGSKEFLPEMDAVPLPEMGAVLPPDKMKLPVSK